MKCECDETVKGIQETNLFADKMLDTVKDSRQNTFQTSAPLAAA